MPQARHENFRKRAGILALALLAAGAPGCGRGWAQSSGQDNADTLRAVKLEVVTAGRAEQIREFVGEVQPVRYWTLGFEVSGRVSEVLFREGEEVKKGQILVRLDKAPYSLKLLTAEADLRDAISNLQLKKEKVAAQDELKGRGYTSLRAIEQAQSELSAAEASVASRQVARDLAQRNLDSTDLISPGDGVVAKRSVEPFVDVNSGQQLMRIDTVGAVQVAVRIPASLIQQTVRGLKIDIRANGQNYNGRVSEVASRVEAGNAFQVIVAVEGANNLLRPGMTANVTFRYTQGGPQSDIVAIPLRAMLPGSSPMQGFVFVYDRATSTLRKVSVNVRDLHNNLLEVVSGLKPGDAVAVAGAAFLSDGQKVTVFNPDILNVSNLSQSDVTSSKP